METQLTRIAELAKNRPKERFTSLAHLINETSLRESHREMNARKAPGIDKVTKEEYEQHLSWQMYICIMFWTMV
jgi:RNA-directed DNA polymerase